MDKLTAYLIIRGQSEMELVMDMGLMGYMGEGCKKSEGTSYNLGQ